MAQAGILGSLRFEEAAYGWCLDLGSCLTRCIGLGGEFLEPSIVRARTENIESIQRLLSNHAGSQVVIPQPFEELTVVNSAVELVFSNNTHAHYAFTLIGCANFALLLGRDLPPSSSTKMHDWALQQLRRIDLRCPGIGLQPDPLYEMLCSIDNDPFSLRKCLREMKIKILLVLSEPQDQRRLRLGQESRALEHILQSSTHRDYFKLDTVPSCRPDDLMHALLQKKPNILHFSGHGNSSGLCFESENGGTEYIRPKPLSKLLSLAVKNGLKGLVLNSCYSSEQAQVMADTVGPVIAMDGELWDKDAIAFTSSFYRALGEGCSFKDAFDWGEAGAGLTSSNDLRPRFVTSRQLGPSVRDI